MKRCSAPCVKKISKTDYFEDIASAKSYLSSSDNQTINKLTSDIEKASDKLQFEKAAEIRDRLNSASVIKRGAICCNLRLGMLISFLFIQKITI
jgi:excinuclease ABC subunit C